MDDDTTTIHRLRSEVSTDIVKFSDRNHVVNAFTSDLYKLKKTNKSLRYNVIAYLKKMFVSAVSQCQQEPDRLRDRLKSITPHMYGEHQLSDPDWCKAKTLETPGDYQFVTWPTENPSLMLCCGRYWSKHMPSLQTRLPNCAPWDLHK